MTPRAIQAAGLAALLLLGGSLALAAPKSEIRSTKHNLSADSGNQVRAETEDQICVFCHTPHGGTVRGDGSAVTPLWNRALSTQTYTTYRSTSLDVLDVMGTTELEQPGGSSKLCLSCHDGTIAIGQINVLDGVQNPSLNMLNVEADGTMPDATDAGTGFTRRLGTDLTNDHPISFTYNDTVAQADGELQEPSLSPTDSSRPGNPRLIDSRAPGYAPALPLENGMLQCSTCHDPHLYDPDDLNRKFLRLNRLQNTNGPSGSFTEDTDQICLACHTKDGWPESAHADPTSANELYDATAAAKREFAGGTAVWEAACLNCHDTHTVQGARRLLREGTTGSANVNGLRDGGDSAIEQTCYQCHSPNGILNEKTLQDQGTAGFEVPDIETDFLSTRHMPIAENPEVHEIQDADLTESRTHLADRHVECTDCHNPHRVRKNKVFDGSGSGTSGTHEHSAPHSNIISGVLRGAWGVEPVYDSDINNAFGNVPIGFDVKSGDPSGSSTAVTEPYVTREYQICFKCHSNYGYDDSGSFTGTPPELGSSSGSTPGWGYSDSDGGTQITTYTNQAMEFQAPSDDQGVKSRGTNHRSWHPVMRHTDRPAGTGSGTRNAAASNWLAPWDGAVGTQTMYCSDCHGSAVSGSGVEPDGGENGKPWGPHGSSNDFLLKAPWSDVTGAGRSNDLCFKCHSYNNYATRNGDSTRSGFWNSSRDNLHAYHADKISNFRCTLCHVAIPHGWKNKALLVNLNDVGPEVGLPAGTEVRKNTTDLYYKAPYYMGAALKVMTWAQSGDWQENDCGSKSGDTGRDWMRDSSENCANPP